MSYTVLARAPVRMRIMLVALFAAGMFLAARLFLIQIVEMDRYSQGISEQVQFKAILPARRGDIVTADGTLLATDVFVYTIHVTPKDIRQPERVADALAPILGQPRHVVLAKLRSTDKNVILAQDVPHTVANRVQEAKERLEKERVALGGLRLQAHLKRVYPANAFAAHVVGYVNLERNAAYGIEQKFDSILRGTDGWMSGVSDALRDLIPFDVPVFQPPINGARIVLTLSSGIQRIAEEELANAVRHTRATGGTIIVLDVKSGAILAMASQPVANLNAYADPANVDKYANPAISAQYEPGSVFKIVTVACALDAGIVNERSVFEDTGSISIGGRTFKNPNDLVPGRVTLTDVLRLSLNVEAVKLSVGLGAERFYQCVRDFGFGSLTRIELANEVAGKVKFVGDSEWREADLATNAFGQGIAVTPLQMIMAVGAVANQGKLMRPYIVQEIQSSNAKSPTLPTAARQVIRPDTARTLTRLLADAISAESSHRATVPGYRIAGKTGTAEIPILGGFDPTWTIASFAGYLPADDPRIAILVKIDKPQTSRWGSEVAAPVFASVAKQVVMVLGIPPDAIRNTQ
ncbi:MAG: penicillin-binding protein 2 [Anaerolineae bacterium]|nr:penicillin-binding protein 2 [Anaerolineae bacterium]